MSVRSTAVAPADLSGYATTAFLADYAKLTDVSSFVGSGSMTVAALLANYPAGAGHLGKYARVSDLYGSVDEVMRCCANGPSGARVYYWRPQRTDYAATSAQAGGAMALTPLLTPPTMFLTGTLTSLLTVTPSTTNVWPGCTFEIVSQGALGIFGAQLGGLIGSSVALVTGGSKLVTFDGTGWRARP